MPKKNIIHQYQFSPTEYEIYEFHNTEIHRWFATEKNNKCIVRVPDTKDTCTNIPSDTYPIQLCSDHSFLIHHHHEGIISTAIQIQNFTEYIKSMPRWIYLLIQYYTVYPSSDSLLYHICNQSELLISTDGSRTHIKSGGS